MSTHRLYVSDALSAGDALVLSAEHSHYVARVLRARPGDELVLFDGRGGEHPASVLRASKHGVTVSIGAPREGGHESPFMIRLFQGVSRRGRMDWVVQKATELGVARITPLVTEFSVVRFDDARADRRVAHWLKIAQGACEQCGRNRLPRIDRPQRFATAIDETRRGEAARIVLHPSGQTSLSAVALPSADAVLMIGPEGGLSDTELDAASNAGFVTCRLGPRTLRTETAALAAITVLQSRLGDLR
ncbi:MAG TPA: 16S rRNA (uracil(1498)-N(3))-methyltransferase [Woeseiaceae bacterium]|nr:16S rRNA (uracil(1498)-N(3))-methyltransferase [Woeseiaceae bacterium]